MIDSRVHVRVALHENLSKVVLPILVRRALKLQDLAVFEICVDYVKVSVWPEHESS
jgi:hypothetical protein